MLGRALSLYRAHFGAILLTTALALLPASLLTAGVLRYSLARTGAGDVAGAPTHSREVQEKIADLKRKDLPPDSNAARSGQLGREAIEGETVFERQGFEWLPAIACGVIAAVLLFAGLLLAHAALVPLVRGMISGQAIGPGEAWGAVGERFGPLMRTAGLELALVALGTLLFVLPGLALATAFVFAVPATLVEQVSGVSALERSLALIKGRWARALGMVALLAMFTVAASALATLAPRAGWQLAISTLVRVVTCPLPLLGLVLLYPRAAEG